MRKMLLTVRLFRMSFVWQRLIRFGIEKRSISVSFSVVSMMFDSGVPDYVDIQRTEFCVDKHHRADSYRFGTTARSVSFSQIAIHPRIPSLCFIEI